MKNPTGTGSTDLTKISIGGTVYNIPSGGGETKLYIHKIIGYNSSFEELYDTIITTKNTPFTLPEYLNYINKKQKFYNPEAGASGEYVYIRYRLGSVGGQGYNLTNIETYTLFRVNQEVSPEAIPLFRIYSVRSPGTPVELMSEEGSTTIWTFESITDYVEEL